MHPDCLYKREWVAQRPQVMALNGGRPISNSRTRGAPANDAEAQLLGEIEELIQAYGARGVVSACQRSTAGTHFERLGSTAALRVSIVILRAIAFAKNPRLEAEIMSLGAGLLREDRTTMQTVADKFGVSKQAISKRVIKFCDQNNLPPSSYMRSKKDRKTYALTNQPRGSV